LSRCNSDFHQRKSHFDGNDLGILGNVEALPTTEEVSIFVKQNFAVKGVLALMMKKCI
jgi:hypothetical protein